MKPSKTKFKQAEIGMIPEEWEETNVGTVCSIKNGKTNTQDAVVNGQYLFFDRSTKIKRSNKFLFDCEAIIVPGEGKEFIPRYYKGKFDLHQRAYAIWKKDKDRNVYLKFIYYWILKNKNYLSRVAVGSTVKSLRLNHLQNFPLRLPSPPEQHAIAKILSDLDSKIELNQQINKTLEAIGQALFKRWFVYFEFPNEEGKPYKSSGGEMVYNEELGKEIPKGWKVDSVYRIVEVIYGFPFNSRLFNEEKQGKPLIRIRDIKTSSIEFYTTEENPRVTLVKAGDIIAGMDGEFTPYIWLNKDAFLNQRLCMFKPKENYIHNFFILQVVRPLLKNEEIAKVGTTVIHLGKTDIDGWKILIPPKKIMESFYSIIQPVFSQIIQNGLQIRTLSQIRDSLLPKLMSGKIRVHVEVK